MMTQPRLQKPLHLRWGQGIVSVPRPKINFHRKPRSPCVPQGYFRRNIITSTQQGFHPRSHRYLPLLFPTGQNVRQEGPHLPLTSQGVSFRCSLPWKKSCRQQLPLRRSLHRPTPHPISPHIFSIRHPGVHAFVLPRHSCQNMNLFPVKRLQLTTHPRKQTVQLHLDLRHHRLELQPTKLLSRFHSHMPFQIRHLPLEKKGQAFTSHRPRPMPQSIITMGQTVQEF